MEVSKQSGEVKEVANIDGQSGKVIKFNVDEGETVLNVSELTNGEEK